MKNIKNLFYLLNHKERIRAITLIFLMLITAVIEMIGIASILPFITILTNPDIIQINSILRNIFDVTKSYGVENIDQFNIVMGIFLFFILLFSMFFKVATSYMQFSFVEMREYSIGKRLVVSYLSQPYHWFLNRHSSQLGATILTEVQAIVAGYLRPLLNLIAKSFVVITILILLILTDPKLTFIVFFFFGFVYLVIYLFFKNKIKKKGVLRLKSNQSRFKILSDAFAAIKEIKIRNHEESYIKIYKKSAKSYARAKVYAQIISTLPRYFLEVISFGGVILLILYLILEKGSFNSSLPIISLYVFAGYRLLPATQNIYESISSIAFFNMALDQIIHDIKNTKKHNDIENKETVILENKISLKNIFFQYPKMSTDILNNINITFPIRSITGLVGVTGSGKTTIIDIVLGLLEPQKGYLEIDSKIITANNIASWQKSIGYVPQNINLIDDSIISNIAFGIDYEDIDKERVEKVSKITKLHNFITNELPQQYQTRVGEHVIRLSGGQRQRIGIARALYNNPKVLVLDEATSALDNETEKEIMDSIKNLSKTLTVIIVAHRIDTIKYCNFIYKIKKGSVIQYGTFDELFLNT